MKRNEARKLADTITNEQLFDMLEKAKVGIKDWTKVSLVNKGMTKGTAWNVLGSNFDVTKNIHVLTKANLIREFGEFLPKELQPPKKKKGTNIIPHHQEPIF
jgi:hypothetical protein